MKKTLLINSASEPLRFVDARRVISLLLRDVIEIVSLWEGDILIPQLNQELPATVRLKRWVKRSAKPAKFRRIVIFERDNWCCQYCSVKLCYPDATIDHVKPQSQGGKTVWKNCVTACKHCNLWKANNTPEKAGMRLIRPVEMPSVLHFWDLRRGQLLLHPEWAELFPKHNI
jgi:5-methylcytosine-specific restriction endonuclease McrA